MPRIIEIALFLTPFLGFAAWRLLFPSPSPPLWLVAGLSGFVVLMLVALIWLWAADAGDAGPALRSRRTSQRPRGHASRLPAMTPPDFLSDPASPRSGTRCPARGWSAAPCGTRWLTGRSRTSTWRPRTAPERVIPALTDAGIKVVPTGLAHGTVTAVVNGRGFEVTTLRRDIETDGRHAVVAFTADWRQDASRRDFTINAMSMTRDGTVFDYFGGTADLAAGRIRFVGDPATRIAEDYLRILRFFRFYARYGRVPPDPDTLAALQAGIPGLARLSIERVWDELRRILAAPDPSEAVELMGHLGIWAAVLPEAAAVSRLAGLPADPVLRLAAMLTGDPSGAGGTAEDVERGPRPAGPPDGDAARLRVGCRSAAVAGGS